MFPASFHDFLNMCLMRDERRRWSSQELLEHSFLKTPLTTASPLQNKHRGDRNQARGARGQGAYDDEDGGADDRGGGDKKMHAGKSEMFDYLIYDIFD